MVCQVRSSVQWHRVQILRELRHFCLEHMLRRESYRFKADLYGTSWYHSHYSAQYTGGLLGPMIVHGPNHYSYDIDLGPVMISDCKYCE